MTDKDIILLRMKCLEPFVMTASKLSLEKGLLFDLGEQAWAFANKPLDKTVEEKPQSEFPSM